MGFDRLSPREISRRWLVERRQQVGGVHLAPVVAHLPRHRLRAGCFLAGGGGVARRPLRPAEGHADVRLVDTVATIRGVAEGFAQVGEGLRETETWQVLKTCQVFIFSTSEVSDPLSVAHRERRFPRLCKISAARLPQFCQI